MKILLQIY